MSERPSMVDWFFKDKHGRWGIAQWPNALLMLWVILLLINFVLHNRSVGLVENAVLFTWAYLEMTEGVSRFRKTLGAVILIGVIVNFFL